MISKGFYFSSKIEKNKGDRDFNILLGYFNVVICNDPPPRLALTDFFQVSFIERTIIPVIRAERKIAELLPKAANAQLTIDWL